MKSFATLASCWVASCAPLEAAPAPAAPAAAVSGPALDDRGAAGAAALVEAYFAAIAEGRFDAAWSLLAADVRPSGATVADFAAAFADYAEYRAEVGPPGAIEGAAGTLWIEVPVRLTGRMNDGDAFDESGIVLLSRCNDVPGCTAGQRRWRIVAENIGLR